MNVDRKTQKFRNSSCLQRLRLLHLDSPGLSDISSNINNPGTMNRFIPTASSSSKRTNDQDMDEINTTCNHENCRKTIFVQKVPLSMTRKELRQFFSKFGKLHFSKIIYDYKTSLSRGLAIVQYVNLNDAQKVLQLPQSDFKYLDSTMRPTPSRCLRLKGTKVSSKRKYAEIKYDNCNQDETKECYFNRLPDELINHIFSFFNFKERIRLERVCKRWRYVNTTVTWENMHELKFDNVIPTVRGRGKKKPKKLNSCGSTLRKIDFSSSRNNVLTKAFPRKLANYCTNLESVNFFGNAIGLKAMKIFAEQCKNLKSVSLEKCDLVVEKSIWFLLKNSNLHHLDLTGNCEITGKCFNFIKDSMKTLILNGCVKLSPVGFKFLENKAGICDLRLNDCILLTPESLITVISSLERSLVELHLGGYFELCNESDYVELFSHCKNLERLNLEKNFHIKENVVSVISRKCPLLCSLNLSATPISDACLTSLKKLSNLRDLSISYIERITDDGLKTLSEIEKLERVELRGCFSIGDSGCISLLLNCNQLKLLDVSSCLNVTDAVVVEASCLARSNNEKLEIIAGNTGITTEMNNLSLKVKLIDLCPAQYHLRQFYDEYEIYSDDDYFDSDDDNFFDPDFDDPDEDDYGYELLNLEYYDPELDEFM